ncbi:MAG: hypothetical protein JSU61_09520 [Fidelibacterota bacterium]|nr:MAG: hypothetical protein JSU61_09520 [Candidatus Neomarinimicrobiota bacterium]
MLHRRIPRWHQCGIFSIWLVWATLWLPQVRGQIPPDLILPKSKTTSLQLSGPSTANITILGLRVAFEPDVNLSTTGDGQFLMSPDSSRCDGFLVDPPPHDADYFLAQLEAVANYYERVTREQVTFDLMGSLVFPPQGHEPILLNRMATYRPVSEEDSTDILLVRLFEESMLAAVDSGLDVFDYDIAVVFHAGLGQDFTYPFLDPTPLDIPSAAIDPEMIQAALGTSGIPIPVGDDLYDLYDRPGIILPEGQNHIYYDIVEDIFPGGSDYCDVQIGLTGTFALLMGYALGLSPLFDTDDG